MERNDGNGRTPRLAACTLAALSLATAAWAACIRPKASCESQGGFCQGSVIACEQGWEDAPDGFKCEASWRRKGKCYLLDSCAPYPCSNPPPECGYPATSCREGGQCCCCTVSVGLPVETELYYWFYHACKPCPDGGGGEN